MRGRALVSSSLVAFAAFLAVVTFVGAARAQERAPILHEYVRPPSGAGRERIVGGGARAAGQAPQKPRVGVAPPNPAAIRHGDRLLPEPPPTPAAGPEEAILGRGPASMDRDTASRPDYMTGPDGRLHYAEVFNPSVVPFKRMSALGAVEADYTMVVGEGQLVPVAVGGDTSTDRDLFWGSMVIELDGARPVAIPSVAPDMRILTAETEPPIPIQFVKDAADNFSVRPRDAETTGQVRLVFLADAAATYFAPRPPPGTPLGDLRGASSDLPPIPTLPRGRARPRSRSCAPCASAPPRRSTRPSTSSSVTSAASRPARRPRRAGTSTSTWSARGRACVATAPSPSS